MDFISFTFASEFVVETQNLACDDVQFGVSYFHLSLTLWTVSDEEERLLRWYLRGLTNLDINVNTSLPK